MRQSITFEGETTEAYDPSWMTFGNGFRETLDLIFGENNVHIDDEGHGGGVEFYGSYFIDGASEEHVSDTVSALIALTDNSGFHQLIVHSGLCDHSYDEE